MPLIKTRVLMVLNAIDPLGPSLSHRKKVPAWAFWALFCWSICFHWLWQNHFPKGLPLPSFPFKLFRNVSLLHLATCIGAKLCSVISPEMKLSWQITTDNTDVRSHLRIWNCKQEKNLYPRNLSKDIILVNTLPGSSEITQKRGFYFLALSGCLNSASW